MTMRVEIVKRVFDVYLNGNKGQALGMYGVARYLMGMITYRQAVNSGGQHSAESGLHWGILFQQRRIRQERKLRRNDSDQGKPIMMRVFSKEWRTEKARNPVNVPPRVLVRQLFLRVSSNVVAVGQG
jgi:hypothetical protein